jgi:hypothetical protein
MVDEASNFSSNAEQKWRMAADEIISGFSLSSTALLCVSNFPTFSLRDLRIGEVPMPTF